MKIISKKTLQFITITFLMAVITGRTFAQWSQNADNIWNTVLSKKIGIGTATPGATLQIGAGTGSLHTGNVGILLKPNAGDRALMELHSPDGNNRLVFQSLSGVSYLGSMEGRPLLLQNTGGNVGIGTNAPKALLDVKGGFSWIQNFKGEESSPTEAFDWPYASLCISGYDNYALKTMLAFTLPQDGNYFTDNSVWNFRLTGTASKPKSDANVGLSLIGPGNLGLGSQNDRKISLITNGLERVTIAGDGNMGIGIANPSGKLHVVDNHVNIRTSEGTSNGFSKNSLTVEGNADAGYSTLRITSGHGLVSDRGLLSIDRVGNSYMYVRMDGNIGIGTLTPAAKLDVQGSIISTQDATINGLTVGRGAGNVSSNTAVGPSALLNNTTGSYNTAVGREAGLNCYAGSYNTALGYIAYPLINGLSNTTSIGYDATPTANNQVRIGNPAVTSIGGYANWTNFSDRRIKKDVQETVPGLAFINKLRPVTYHLNMEEIAKFLKKPDDLHLKDAEAARSRELQTGFIAQEVEKAAQELNFEFSGVDKAKNENDLYGLRYAEFTVPLVKAVQELSKQNDSLKTELSDLKTQMDNIIQQLNELKTNNTRANSFIEMPTKDIGITNTAGIMVYPNPTNESFTVVTNHDLKDTKIQLLDMFGNAKNILVQDVDKYSKKIQVRNLAAGMYIVVLSTGTRTEKAKIVIQ